jgi:hypothetical protein
MSTTALATLSKGELESKVRGLMAARSRSEREGASIRDALYGSLGSVSAFTASGLLGLVEGRVRNKDGSPCSLGPVPLPLAAGVPLTLVSWFWDPGRQVSAAAHGCMGMLGGSLGRGWGTAWRQRATQEKQGVGAEDLTPEEQSLVFE